MGMALMTVLATITAVGGCKSAEAAQSSMPIFLGADKTIFLDGRDQIAVDGENIVSVSYQSTKKNIATVSKKGVVVPKKKGKTKIKAKVVCKNMESGTKYTKTIFYPLNVLDKTKNYMNYKKNDTGSNLQITGLTTKGKKLKEIYIPDYIGKMKVVDLSFEALKKQDMTLIHIGDNITDIAGDAIKGCSKLKTIFIGKKIKNIYLGEFLKDCSSLNRIEVDSRNKAYTDRDGVLYNHNYSELCRYPNAKPSDLYCIPEGVEQVKYMAFANSTKLKSVEIADTVVNIEDKVFENSGIQSITIPNTVSNIASEAFKNCKNLKSVTLPDKDISLTNKIFENCVSLTSINIPAQIRGMSNNSFDGCANLSEINVSADNMSFCSVDGAVYSKDKSILLTFPRGKASANYEIPKGTKVIGRNAFGDCKKVENVTFPNSYIIIGDYAFRNSGLRKVILSEKVTSVGMGAYSDCVNLTDLTLSERITEVMSFLCSGCTSLTNVNLPVSIESIDRGAFKGCTSLSQLTVPAKVKDIVSDAFDGYTKFSGFVVSPDNSTYASSDGILYSKSLHTLMIYPSGKVSASFTVPENTSAISYHAFSGSKSVKKVIIPSTVTKLHDSAFEESACFKKESI